MIHDLKLDMKYFPYVSKGVKNFELRLDDRGFKVGDTLVLREWDPVNEKYTGEFIKRKVTYCLKDCYGLEKGYVILSVHWHLKSEER